MCGEIEMDSLKDVLLVCEIGFPRSSSDISTHQIWIKNRATLEGLSTLAYRVSAGISALANAFLGQTVSQARLNAITGYDCSNDLFQVSLQLY